MDREQLLTQFPRWSLPKKLGIVVFLVLAGAIRLSDSMASLETFWGHVRTGLPTLGVLLVIVLAISSLWVGDLYDTWRSRQVTKRAAAEAPILREKLSAAESEIQVLQRKSQDLESRAASLNREVSVVAAQREELTRATERVAHLEATIREKGRENYEHQLALMDADRARATAQRDAHSYYTQLLYGFELQEFSQADTAQRSSMRERLDEMRTDLGHMIEAACKSWLRVGERMPTEKAGSLACYYWQSVDSVSRVPLEMAKTRLIELLDHSDGDPREVFVLTYKIYWRFRSLLGRCATVKNVDFAGWPEFRSWLESAGRFNAVFRRVVGVNPSEGVKLLREVQEKLRAFHANFHNDPASGPNVDGLPPGPFDKGTT